MTRIFAIVLISLAASSGAGAAAVPGATGAEASRSAWVEGPDGERSPLIPGKRPFGVGERMEFVVSFGLLDIGRATLEVGGESLLRGRPVLEISNQARSATWVDRIFKIRDRVDSEMDRDRLYSLGFRKRIHEGNYRREMRADYFQDRGVASYDDGDVELRPGSHDILTALYLLRTLSLEPGMHLGIPLHDDKKNYLVNVDVLRQESVETELGELDCVVLEPKLKSGGIFNKAGRLWIWISQDDRKMIVQMKSKAPVGAFTSLITAYTPPR